MIVLDKSVTIPEFKLNMTNLKLNNVLKMESFKTFARTQIGKSHVKLQYNCQDYSFQYRDDDKIILIVADGVGGIPFSECSAILESFSIVSLLQNRTPLDLNNKKVINHLITEQLKVVKQNVKNTIMSDYVDNSLYGNTLIVCTLTKDVCNIYAKGDGYYGVNGDIKEVIKNREFIADCVIQHQLEIPTDDISSVVIATDGLRFFPIKDIMLSTENIKLNFSSMDRIISDCKDNLEDDLGIGIISKV